MSNNGRRARLGSGGPCRLPSHMRTEGCPHRATIMGQGRPTLPAPFSHADVEAVAVSGENWVGGGGEEE